MKTSAKVSLGALALALIGGAGLASSRQQSAPESLLPPGFNDPVAPAPAPRPGGPAPAAPPTSDQYVPPPPIPGVTDTAAVPPLATPEETPEIDPAEYELPPSATRSLGDVGAIGPDSGGIAADGFAGANGAMVERLMRRLDAPIPSRWLSIALRRALVSRSVPPSGVNGADFAAERAWLLLRMGEADMARALVQSVDIADYTPKMHQIALQAMLATADPAGACPFAETASQLSYDRAWPFVRAMCASLSGEGQEARTMLRKASRNGRSLDALLAQKVVGAASQGGAVTIEATEWNGVDQLTAWRYGLATATGVAIPEPLLDGARAQVAAWRATAPMVPPADRARYAEVAAAMGVLSSEALVDLYGEIEASDDGNSAAAALARDLRSADTDGSADQRVAKMRDIWGTNGASGSSYARLVLTARAAGRLKPDAKYADDSGRLIASMLSAGLDLAALRWRTVAPAGSDGWAMLALANPRPIAVDGASVGGFPAGNSGQKAKMLLAGLAGLGRLPAAQVEQLAQSLDVKVGAQNSWTRAIDTAAERREAGTVLLLAAVGMQTPNWRGVPPEVLYHSVAALRAVGQEGTARMIAAEAIARL